MAEMFIFYYTLFSDKGLFEHQLTCVRQFAGIINQTYARITRKLVFVVLEIAASFYMIAVTTNMAGSWNENGEKEATASKIHMPMK